jgi:glycosyltransferase involved in cell wall biosynthesis
MMGEPRVSVVVPVRNGERFVAQALESVLAQELAPRQIVVVVDPGSTDRTSEIVRSFRGVTVVTQAGEGIAQAWNQGIESTTEPFIAFLSADDLWTPDKLRVQTEWMRGEPRPLFSNTLFRYFLEAGHALPSGFNPGLLERDLEGRIMETLLARREAFEEVGPFDRTLPVSEDVDWFARASDLGCTRVMVPRVLLRKRIHDRNLSAASAATVPLLTRILKRSLDRRRHGQGARPREEDRSD